jgi:transcriptional regulator NrdR family protein
LKCPLCKAPTEVKHTKDDDGTPIRRRHCYNEHSFNTKEVAISEPKPKRRIRKVLAVSESGRKAA